MTFLHWTKDLELGIESIDAQHQKLVDYINEIAEANDNHDRVALGIALEHLVNYTIEHFAYEEEMLNKAGYPLLAAHSRVHQNFVNKVAGFKTRFDYGEDVAGELLDLMDGWLFAHIRRNDQGYVETVRKSGIAEQY